MSKVNVKVYGEFVQLFTQAAPVLATAKQAKEAKAGIYTNGMKIGSECADLAEATATFDALVHDIQCNVGGLAVKVGGQPRQETSKDGQTHKLPESVSTIKSAVLFAFENGIALLDKDGKPISFTALRKIRKEIGDAKKAADQQQAIASLSGVDKVRHDLRVRVADLMTATSAMTVEQLSIVGSALDQLVVALSPPKADEPTTEEPKAEKPKKARKGKAKGSNADVGDEMAKAA